MEDLGLPDDGAVEPAGDRDEVADGGDVLEALGTGRQLGQRRREGARGDVQLDPMAGVDDQMAGPLAEGRELGRERLPPEAGDGSGVGDEGDDRGAARARDRGDRALRHRRALRDRHGRAALPGLAARWPRSMARSSRSKTLDAARMRSMASSVWTAAPLGDPSELVEERQAEREERVGGDLEIDAVGAGESAVTGRRVERLSQRGLALVRGRGVHEAEHAGENWAAGVAEASRSASGRSWTHAFEACRVGQLATVLADHPLRCLAKLLESAPPGRLRGEHAENRAPGKAPVSAGRDERLEVASLGPAPESGRRDPDEVARLVDRQPGAGNPGRCLHLNPSISSIRSDLSKSVKSTTSVRAAAGPLDGPMAGWSGAIRPELARDGRDGMARAPPAPRRISRAPRGPRAGGRSSRRRTDSGRSR